MIKAIKLDRDAIYTLANASAVTGVSKASLRGAIKSKQLNATKRGAFWFIKGSELEQWLVPAERAEPIAAN